MGDIGEDDSEDEAPLASLPNKSNNVEQQPTAKTSTSAISLDSSPIRPASPDPKDTSKVVGERENKKKRTSPL